MERKQASKGDSDPGTRCTAQRNACCTAQTTFAQDVFCLARLSFALSNLHCHRHVAVCPVLTYVSMPCGAYVTQFVIQHTSILLHVTVGSNRLNRWASSLRWPQGSSPRLRLCVFALDIARPWLGTLRPIGCHYGCWQSVGLPRRKAGPVHAAELVAGLGAVSVPVCACKIFSRPWRAVDRPPQD